MALDAFYLGTAELDTYLKHKIVKLYFIIFLTILLPLYSEQVCVCVGQSVCLCVIVCVKLKKNAGHKLM